MTYLQQRIFDLARRGLSAAKISERIGVSTSHVYNTLDGAEFRIVRTIKRRAKLPHPVREYTCSRCGEVGHNKLTCTSAEIGAAW